MTGHSDFDEARVLADSFALVNPSATLAWQAVVDVGERASLGPSPWGQRWIVPITGGVFWGAHDFAAMRGRVLPGGADRQIVRGDAVRELDALYEMQVDDGTVLTIRNQVRIDDTGNGARYAMSQIQVTAPDGVWSLLNRRVFVGTLHPLPSARRAVLVRAFLLS